MFPKIDYAWRKNQLEDIEEIKLYGCMLELAHDGRSDSPGYNAAYNIVSTIDTAKNKLNKSRVVHVNVWNYLNETTDFFRFCVFCTLRA